MPSYSEASRWGRHVSYNDDTFRHTDTYENSEAAERAMREHNQRHRVESAAEWEGCREMLCNETLDWVYKCPCKCYGNGHQWGCDVCEILILSISGGGVALSAFCGVFLRDKETGAMRDGVEPIIWIFSILEAIGVGSCLWRMMKKCKRLNRQEAQAAQEMQTSRETISQPFPFATVAPQAKSPIPTAVEIPLEIPTVTPIPAAAEIPLEKPSKVVEYPRIRPPEMDNPPPTPAGIPPDFRSFLLSYQEENARIIGQLKLGLAQVFKNIHEKFPSETDDGSAVLSSEQLPSPQM